jgi:DNA-binding NtrC family response regulator
MNDLSTTCAVPEKFPQLAQIAVDVGNDCFRFGRLYGNSEAMRKIYRLIAKVAPTGATVLVVGESGSGKELVATTIHDMSERCAGPFVAVNCGAIPPTLIEAELFGYEKGAFTGAGRMHKGLFERAAGGTLFLDEITEMASEMQVRLLRVLETGVFARVGGEIEVRADVRVITATNREPIAAVHEGHLREDLMYRLAVFPIELPPLRARGDDVALLSQHFVAELCSEFGTKKELPEAVLNTLCEHSWPGNVRELRNVLQRAFILADDTIEIDPAELKANLRRGHTSSHRLQFDIGIPLAEVERQTIVATLDHFRGNKRRCAEVLGVSLKTLYNRLSEYDTCSVPAA